MITLEPSLTFLTIAILALFCVGLCVLFFGQHVPGKGSWLIWAAILFFIAAIGLDSGIFFQEDFKVKVWKVGWIGNRNEVGAITVGVLQDYLGLGMSVLSAILAGSLLMNHRLLMSEPRPDCVFAGLAVSTAGVALTWISLTPWFAFAGLMVTLLGGLICLGSRWDRNADARCAARFLSERSMGLLLAIFGACILATSRFALLLTSPAIWMGSQDGELFSTQVGSILVLVGLLVQMHPFPLLGWIVTDSELAPPLRMLMNQIFPAWASFALLVRLEPHFRSIGLFPFFGWITLVSSVLAVWTGLFQKKVSVAISAWLSAGFSLSVGLLAFGGPMNGMSMLVGVSLSALSLAIAISYSNQKRSVPSLPKKRGAWIQLATVLSAAAGTGFLGFISMTGGLDWMLRSPSLSAVLPCYLFTFAWFVFLRWKLTWSGVRSQKEASASWVSIFSLFWLVFLSFAVVWTGTWSGGSFLEGADRLCPSLFHYFFGTKATESGVPTELLSILGAYWGVFLLAFTTSCWASAFKEDRWQRLYTMFPKMSRFLGNGYEIDHLMTRVGTGLIVVGAFIERIVDQKMWARWLPQGLFWVTQTAARWVSYWDSALSTGLMGFLRRWVDVPAKVLQLIQLGDLRWYLIFALGSGFALLTHFLRS